MTTRRTDDELRSTRQTNDGLRKVCRCPRRVWAKCDHSWHFNFKWRGVSYRYSLDKLLRRKVRFKIEVVIEAERMRDAIRAGTFNPATWASPAPVVVAPDQLTFAAYGDIFFEQCPKRKGKDRGKPRGADDRSRLNRLARPARARAARSGRCRSARSSRRTSKRRCGRCAQKAARRARTTNTCSSVRASRSGGSGKGYLTRSWFVDRLPTCAARTYAVTNGIAGCGRTSMTDDGAARVRRRTAAARGRAGRLQRLIIARDRNVRRGRGNW